jgi:hypothetical protein
MTNIPELKYMRDVCGPRLLKYFPDDMTVVEFGSLPRYCIGMCNSVLDCAVVGIMYDLYDKLEFDHVPKIVDDNLPFSSIYSLRDLCTGKLKCLSGMFSDDIMLDEHSIEIWMCSVEKKNLLLFMMLLMRNWTVFVKLDNLSD